MENEKKIGIAGKEYIVPKPVFDLILAISKQKDNYAAILYPRKTTEMVN